MMHRAATNNNTVLLVKSGCLNDAFEAEAKWRENSLK
jgi:hypothetical protein